LPDGQFPHAAHARIARRANLPQVSALAPSGKSERLSFASRLDEKGRFGRSSRYVGRGCDGRGSVGAIGNRRAIYRERLNGAQTNGAEADGEVVWSWHPLLMLSLAEASIGPTGRETPSIREVTVTKRNSSPGEREGNC
jgi:hypothetical protein